MRELVRQRITNAKPGGLGIVTNTRYVRCFWPRLDRPTALFAAGSSGIEVQGPPTPRNVVFPPDTVFLNGTRGDCFFLREKVAGDRPGKPDEYTAEVTREEADALVNAEVTERDLSRDRQFTSTRDPTVMRTG
jgi:hypothetical protein